MYKKVILAFMIFIIILTGCMKTEAPSNTILCGTSMIASMVRDLAPEAEIVTLVPHLACPGTFDMKPDDAKKAAAAKVFIIHPFQSYLAGKIKKINKRISVEVIDVRGLNTPGEYMAGLGKTEEVLLKYMPERQTEFDNRRQLMSLHMEEAMKADFSFRKGIADSKISVICSVLQADTANYAGFRIAGTFGSPDAMTPDRLKELADAAKKKGVKYIISNLTGDNDMTADIINRQVKAVKIVLSSFPEEAGDNSWYFNLYNYNMDAIKKAMAGR